MCVLHVRNVVMRAFSANFLTRWKRAISMPDEDAPIGIGYVRISSSTVRNWFYAHDPDDFPDGLNFPHYFRVHCIDVFTVFTRFHCILSSFLLDLWILPILPGFCAISSIFSFERFEMKTKTSACTSILVYKVTHTAKRYESFKPVDIFWTFL